MKIILVFVCCLMLSSCLSPEDLLYQKSLDFCDGKDKIKEYRTLATFSTVECLDGRKRELRN